MALHASKDENYENITLPPVLDFLSGTVLPSILCYTCTSNIPNHVTLSPSMLKQILLIQILH